MQELHQWLHHCLYRSILQTGNVQKCYMHWLTDKQTNKPQSTQVYYNFQNKAVLGKGTHNSVCYRFIILSKQKTFP